MSRITITTAILTTLSSTYISSGLTQALFLIISTASASPGLVGRGFCRCRARNAAMRFVNFGQFGAVAAERSGGEECVFCRQDEVAPWRGCALYIDQLGSHVVAREQVHALDIVAGDQPLNFIEHRVGIEGADLGLDLTRGKKDGVTVGLAGLRTA